MTNEHRVETGTRARTRRAILDAAVSVLSQDSSATLGDIAAAAGVGRTTLHRYFAERSDLIEAIGLAAVERVAAASERARLDEGPALEALARLCQEYFELGDMLMLVFNEPQFMDRPEWKDDSAADRALRVLLERGQAEGTLDPALSEAWIQSLLWALLYSAWEYRRTNCATKHDALSLCLRSLRKAVATEA